MSSSQAEPGDLQSYGQIVLFGDSITEQSFNADCCGYGAAFANKYARTCDIVNRGFSGYTTDQALQLLPRIFPQRHKDVKLIIFFFGANDAVLSGNQQHVPIKRFLSNCEHIFTSAAVIGKVIVVTPPPIEEYSHEVDFGRTRTAQTTYEYGSALKELCLRLKIPVADVWSKMMKQVGWEDGARGPLPGSMDIPKNEKLASFFHDGLHPIAAGYKLIYEVIRATIDQANLEGLSEPHTPYWAIATAPRGNLIRWRMKTSIWTEEEFKRLLTLVPKEDATKINRFHFAKDQRMALASCLLQNEFVRTILGYTSQQDFQVVPRDEKNRPFLKHQSVRPNDFNVSHHAGTCVLVGHMEAGCVGVDVTIAEHLKPGESLKDYLSSFQDSFSVDEWRAIDNSLSRFAQHWALKEAYVKYHGDGIVLNLKEVEFQEVKYVDTANPLKAQAAKIFLQGKPLNLFFELHLVENTYIAVATEVETQLAEFTELPTHNIYDRLRNGLSMIEL